MDSNLNLLHQQCEDVLQYTFEKNPLANLFVNLNNGFIINANQKACKFYGYSKDMLKTMKIGDLHKDCRKNVIEKMKIVAEESCAKSDNDYINLEYESINGSVREVEVYCSKVKFFDEEMLWCQIVDITHIRNEQLNSFPGEKGFRALVELSPNAIIVCDDYYIVFANEKASSLLGTSSSNELISRFLLDFVHSEDIHNIVENINEIIFKKSKSIKKQFKCIDNLGNKLDVEVFAKYISFNDKDCVQLIVRDITSEKKEIKRAVAIQERSLINKFPLDTKAKMSCLWMPAMDVSGDFYEFHKDDECVIGIIGDVCGKGATAALNVSAIRVLFHEAIGVANDPAEIMDFLNAKITEHLNEDYVAAMCFKINFKYNILKVVGAGISEFIHVKRNKSWRRSLVKGPFLGMFKNSHFGQSLIAFQKADKLLFYTDGMDSIFNDDSVIGRVLEMESKEYIKFLRKKVYRKEKRNDDTTCLVIDIL